MNVNKKTTGNPVGRIIPDGKLRCRLCEKVIQRYEVISYEDLTGWCSADCFRKERLAEPEKPVK